MINKHNFNTLRPIRAKWTNKSQYSSSSSTYGPRFIKEFYRDQISIWKYLKIIEMGVNDHNIAQMGVFYHILSIVSPNRQQSLQHTTISVLKSHTILYFKFNILSGNFTLLKR